MKFNILKKILYGSENRVLKEIFRSRLKKEVISIIGSSGSGKSTCLKSINLLETPTAGEILYRGQNVLDPEYDLTHYREKLGMVFEALIFLKFKCLEEIPFVLSTDHPQARSLKPQKKVAKKTLKSRYGISMMGCPSETAFRRPKQQVAHRACPFHGSDAIPFDEPTRPGPTNGWGSFENHAGYSLQEGLTMIVVTHKMEFAAMSLVVSSSWTRVIAGREIKKKSLVIPKKNGPRNSFNAATLSLETVCFSMEASCFCTSPLLFKAEKKPEASLVLVNNKLMKYIFFNFDDFRHKNNQSSAVSNEIFFTFTSLSQGNDRHFTGICFFRLIPISRNFSYRGAIQQASVLLSKVRFIIMIFLLYYYFQY